MTKHDFIMFLLDNWLSILILVSIVLSVKYWKQEQTRQINSYRSFVKEVTDSLESTLGKQHTLYETSLDKYDRAINRIVDNNQRVADVLVDRLYNVMGEIGAIRQELRLEGSGMVRFTEKAHRIKDPV